MGKKKGTAGPSATAGATKVGLDWSASTISKREENKLRLLGLISSAESVFHHPGSSSRPKPSKGFTVMFAAFLFRGLSLPAHEFLRSLLFFYGIQLWQLSPNSILHLSIFINLCEAFLSIDPHWGLWRKIFDVKRHNSNDAPPLLVASASLSEKSSDDNDEVPLTKRAKILSERTESAKQLNPSTTDPTPPPRTSVAKVPLSTVNPSAGASAPPISRDHPIFATVDARNQFTRPESKNVQLRKAIKTSADQVLEANQLTTEVQNENTLLKDELKKLKKKMKDEQEARHEAFIIADEKEGVLRESITDLLSTADMSIDRTSKL
ncbi:hypothetical protein QYE76_023568 [Lolium multiflorum]|uniref:Transposase (putative) gypsy type domain-containing protein n=1 Tax=Lolium multiflorum TaxID=4521 RepID=A0AAD8VU88_LOLMU|nr:hypothetical protein QYE76_023568 [Lolium multiflorum]